MDATPGGAVGGIDRDEVAWIVADLMDEHDADLDIWIRPEQSGPLYTIEWTPLESAEDILDHPHDRSAGTMWTAGTIRGRAGQLLSQLTAVIRKRMPTFDVDRTPINLFAVDDRYFFKHYFEQDDVFDALRRYYNGDEYRFEVPETALEDVRTALREHYFEPVIIRDLEPFCVVQRKHTDHPEILFKASVLKKSTANYHVFLMQDQLSVEQAVNSGATPLHDADIEFSI